MVFSVPTMCQVLFGKQNRQRSQSSRVDLLVRERQRVNITYAKYVGEYLSCARKKSKSNRVGETEAEVFDGRDSWEIKLIVFWDLPGVPVVKILRG